MSRFIESICFRGGHYQLLHLHQERINKTFAHFFKSSVPHDLKKVLPDLPFLEPYKVRMVYDHQSLDIDYAEYVPRSIKSLKLVVDDSIDYAYKYEDRSAIDRLLAQKGNADDILICKNGLITDSSYSNLAFWDGSAWYIPANGLLSGVKRAYYLNKGTLRAMDIRIEDLARFQKVSLINAMLNLGDCVIDKKDISEP